MVTVVELAITPEGGPTTHYRFNVTSDELARVIVNQVQVLLAESQVVRARRLSEVYKTLIDLSDPVSGECDCYQDEVATRVGLSTRHLRRIIIELEKMGLVIVHQTARGRKSKNSYFLPHRATAFGIVCEADKLQEPSKKTLSGFFSKSHPDMSAMNHDDGDDEKHDKNDSITWQASSTKQAKGDKHLLFLHEGERRKRLRQAHCTPEYLKAWDEWWAAGQFTGFTNPAGWANLQIKESFWPPTIMPRLPHLDGGLSSSLDGSDNRESEPVNSEDQLWSEVLAYLQPQMTRATFETLLKDTRLACQAETRFTIAVPNGFAKGWLENRLSTIIKRAIGSVISVDIVSIELEFVVS